jgi:ribosomal protein S11
MIKKRKNFKLIKQKRKKRGLLGYNKKIPLHLLHINITKSNLKVSVSKAVNGNIVFKKSEGGVQEIKRGSINSAHASKQMIDDLIINLKRLKIKKFGIYLKGATR